MNIYHRFNGRTLQDWYSIQIDRDGESVEVTFCSRIHFNKQLKCSITFSDTFTDSEILRDPDLARWIKNRYGADIYTEA